MENVGSKYKPRKRKMPWAGFRLLLADCLAAPHLAVRGAMGQTELTDQCGLTNLDGSTEINFTILAPEFSPIGNDIINILHQNCSLQQGITWNYHTDTSLPDDFVLQTPPESHWGMSAATFHGLSTLPCDTTQADCDPDFALIHCASDSDCDAGTCNAVQASVAQPGETPQNMCTGPSDYLYEDMYQAIIQAEDYVDVTSLVVPNGKFEAALRNAMTFLAYSNRTVQLRLLFADVPFSSVEADSVLDALSRDVPAQHQLTLHVGLYRYDDESWNHSKTIAVDNTVLIQGGHNLKSHAYLDTAPAHDISMKLSGSHVVDAHTFANRLWEIICKGNHHIILPWVTVQSAYLPADAQAVLSLTVDKRKRRGASRRFLLAGSAGPVVGAQSPIQTSKILLI